MSVLISVLVPTYRAEHYLGILIDSVKSQTFTDWELLILDDGSGDLDRPSVCSHLSDPRIQTFRWQINRGVSEATRFLMKRVTGEFWCYPGADDLLAPSFLERRLVAMETHKEAALVFGKGGQIDANGEEIWFHEGRLTFSAMEPYEDKIIEANQMLELLLTANVINTPSIFARTLHTLPILLRYSVDWRYCQDWFYWLLLAGNGLKFFYSGEILHSYRFHDKSLTQSEESWAFANVEPSLVLLAGLAYASQTGELALKTFQNTRVKLFANWIVRSARFRTHPSYRRWRSLSRLAEIRWLEWPLIAWYGLGIFRIRRQYRINGRPLHGLPPAMARKALG